MATILVGQNSYTVLQASYSTPNACCFPLTLITEYTSLEQITTWIAVVILACCVALYVLLLLLMIFCKDKLSYLSEDSHPQGKRPSANGMSEDKKPAKAMNDVATFE